MPSRTESVSRWNRKGHIYLGLFFLFFVWLFAFTGLLLNHPEWRFAEFWPQRKISEFERRIDVPRAGSDPERARDILRQLGITGEIELPASGAGASLREFRASRPGHNFAVALRPDPDRALVQHTEINGWGVLRVLHVFSGVRAGDARNERDWILTKIWVLSMDAVSAGLVLMVLTGLYLWYGLPAKRKTGALALLAGTMTCAMFVAGLRWLCS